jgi:hypothetical protein
VDRVRTADCKSLQSLPQYAAPPDEDPDEVVPLAAVRVTMTAQGAGHACHVIHMRAGESSTTYDGREAWAAGPQDLTPVTLLSLVGLGVKIPYT